MPDDVGYSRLYSLRPEIVVLVAGVVALDIHRILRRHREPARIRCGSNRAQRYVAQRAIDQFQNVARPADPVLACGAGATVDSRSVRIVRHGRADLRILTSPRGFGE